MSIKERIIEYCEKSNISVRQFEIKSKMSNGYVSSIRKGLGVTKLENVLNAFPDLSRDWLLYGEGEMLKKASNPVAASKVFSLKSDQEIPDLQRIPLYELTATAGLVAIFQDAVAAPDDFISVPGLPPVDGAIFVRGDSMTPVLKSGDIVIYKKMELSEDSILWGQIYLLSYSNESDCFTVVKYLRHSDKAGFVRLVSENSFYDPLEIPASSITALALVKASITFHTIG